VVKGGEACVCVCVVGGWVGGGGDLERLRLGELDAVAQQPRVHAIGEMALSLVRVGGGWREERVRVEMRVVLESGVMVVVVVR
jgi:hypothetical protein